MKRNFKRVFVASDSQSLWSSCRINAHSVSVAGR